MSKLKITLKRLKRDADCYSSDLVTDGLHHVITYQLIDQSTMMEVGYVDLLLTNYGHYETHMWIDEELRGKGLGVKLLSRAFDLCLRRGYKLMSSTYTSNDAIKLWKSKKLNSTYLIDVVPALKQVCDLGDSIPRRRRKTQYVLAGKRNSYQQHEGKNFTIKESHFRSHDK